MPVQAQRLKVEIPAALPGSLLQVLGVGLSTFCASNAPYGAAKARLSALSDPS